MPKSNLYVAAVEDARRQLKRRVGSNTVVENLLHDNRYHVLFPSQDGRSIGEDCRDCAEQIVGDARALIALATAPASKSKLAA